MRSRLSWPPLYYPVGSDAAVDIGDVTFYSHRVNLDSCVFPGKFALDEHCIKDFKSMLAGMRASTGVEVKLFVEEFNDTKCAVCAIANDNI